MKTARVVIELSFHKGRIPKRALEEMVMYFSSLEDLLIEPFVKYDETLSTRVFYEDLSGVPQVSVLDVMPKPNIMKLFRLGRKNKEKKNEKAKKTV